jgi:uncharacterized protein YbjT (DUF2867 family)
VKMEETFKQPIFVTGATGTQGSAVAQALLAARWPVRVLVRDKNTASACALAALGAELVEGDLDDDLALARGVAGAHGVFSVPIVGMDDDPGLEMRAGKRLVAAARAADVMVFVHSSVARAGDHESFVDWDSGKWWPRYWRDKAAYNKLVQQTGFRHQVILKPAFMMENFTPPKALYMAPHLAQGRLVTAYAPDSRLDVIAAADIAAFALAAFNDPKRFDGAAIDLAATRVTMGELAEVITSVTGKTVKAVHLSPDEALAAGIMQMVVDMQQWNNVEGYRVDLAGVTRWGLPITSLESWAAANREHFNVG